MDVLVHQNDSSLLYSWVSPIIAIDCLTTSLPLSTNCPLYLEWENLKIYRQAMAESNCGAIMLFVRASTADDCMSP